MTTTPQVTVSVVSTRQSSPRLFNASGLARRLQASSLSAIGPAAPGPALRRGALVAVPIGASLIVELGFDSPTKGAIATGALLAGFPGLDAPARPRAGWQAAATPMIGLAAALGVLSSQTAPTAVLAMGLVGAAAGYCFAVSLRLAIVGLSVALALMIGQGLFLAPGDAWPALLYATAGGLLQAVWSLFVWLVSDRAAEGEASGWSTGAALTALRSNLTLRSSSARHAVRFGAALAAGVALYRILGLIVATAVAETVGGDDLVIGIVLTVSAALTFGLLTVHYALFTAAITTYVVLLTDTLGEPAVDAAGQRASGTALGILIAAVAFLLWPNPGEGRMGPEKPRLAPPEAAAR